MGSMKKSSGLFFMLALLIFFIPTEETARVVAKRDGTFISSVVPVEEAQYHGCPLIGMHCSNFPTTDCKRYGCDLKCLGLHYGCGYCIDAKSCFCCQF